jgi:long-chain acyl-CoA synthetase
VKLQHGEYISLGKVESELKTCQLIEFICVYADSTKTFCVALVAPAEIGLKTLADSLGISGDFDQLVVNQQMQKEILKAIVDHSKKCNLAKFEVPTQYTIVKEQWTPESGLVTAAFKIKRKDILDKYKADITRMYS